MWNENKGFMLLESMIAMIIISVSVLFIMSSIVFIRYQEKDKRDMLELAVFMDELQQTRTTRELEDWMIQKADAQGIKIRVWKEGNIKLEKARVQLSVYQK